MKPIGEWAIVALGGVLVALVLVGIATPEILIWWINN